MSNSLTGEITITSSTDDAIGSISCSNNINSVISININNDIIEFTELLFNVLGYDITFEEFSKMTKEERRSMLRDVKINRLLENDK
jgi:hypothetical protein